MHLEKSSSVGLRSKSIARQIRRSREQPRSDVCRSSPDLMSEQSAHALLSDVLGRVALARQTPAVTDQVRIVLVEDGVEIDGRR